MSLFFVLLRSIVVVLELKGHGLWGSFGCLEHYVLLTGGRFLSFTFTGHGQVQRECFVEQELGAFAE